MRKSAVILLLAFFVMVNVSPLGAYASAETLIPKFQMTPYGSSLDYPYSLIETIQTLTDGYMADNAGYFATSHETNPSMIVDLGGYYLIESLKFCYSIANTFDTFDIFVSDDGYSWTPVVSNVTLSSSFFENEVPMAGAKGRWIKAKRLSGSTTRPQVPEISVAGIPIGNSEMPGLLSPNKITATASSSVSLFAEGYGFSRQYAGDASFTKDNDLYTGYWQSAEGDSNPWISYDLGSIQDLDSAVFYTTGTIGYAMDIYTKSQDGDWVLAKADYMVNGEVETTIDAALSGSKSKIDLSDIPDTRYIKFQRKDGAVWQLGEVCFNVMATNKLYTEISKSGWTASAYGTSTEYPSYVPSLGINGFISPGNWWVSEHNQKKGDWYKVDFGETKEFTKLTVLESTQTLLTGHEFDLMASNDDNGYVKIGHFGNQRYLGPRAVFDFDNTISARYVKMVLTNETEIAKEWNVCDVSIYNSEVISDANFFQINGQKAVPMSKLFAGTIRSSVNVSSIANSGKPGLLISGLYDKANGRMEQSVLQPFTFSRENQEISVDINIDKAATGLAGTIENKNLALEATASYKSHDNEGYADLGGSNGVPAENAIDNDFNTRSCAAGAWNWTLLVDLLKDYNVGYMELTFADNGQYASAGGGYPTDYDILTSVDGMYWDKAVSVTGNNRAGTFTFEFPVRKTHYIRVRDNLAQPEVRQMEISEFKVYRERPTEEYNYANKATPMFKSIDGSRALPSSGRHFARYTIDNNENTYACAAFEWNYMMELDLNNTYEVGYIDFTFVNGQFPIDFDVFVTDSYTESFNESEWTKVYSNSNNTRAGKFTLEFSPRNVRYVRIRDNVSQEANEIQMAISDMNIYKQAPRNYELRTFLWDSLDGLYPIKTKVDILK